MSNSITEKLQQAFGRFNAQDLVGTERLCGEILGDTPGQPDALHLLGVVRLMGGNPREAVSLIGRALGTQPQDTAMLENLGVAHLAAANPVQAEALFRRALGLGARHATLHMRLGLALGAQGKFADAVASMSTAAAIAPQEADIQLNLGNALAEAGQTDEALACYRRALALQPRYVDAHYNIGTLLKRAGRDDEAISAYLSALAFAPNHADAHHNLGMVYQGQGRLQEAASCYRKVLALDPNHVASMNTLGNVLREQGQRAEAVACYEKAIKARPDHADAYINLGNVWIEQHRYAEARELYEKVLGLEPGSLEAHHNLGNLLATQGLWEGAIAHYRKALERDPSRAFVHLELGRAYRQVGRLDAASACFRKALEISPDDASACYNLAETCKLQGELDEAVAWYERALAQEPNHLAAMNSMVHVRQHLCRWDGLERRWEQLRSALAAGNDGEVTPFSMLSLPTSAAEQLACARSWARKQVAPFAAARPAHEFDFSKRGPRDRLRVGYLSWGFHRHATSYWIAELIELHDRRRCEVFAYDYGPDDGSEIRARIRKGCDRFVEIANESHLAAARRIYGDEVDVLVDLTGYTLGARPQIIALRPVPVQVSWFYPGTMGTDLMDCFIADPFVVPPGSERYFAENIVRLPDCYMITDRRREVSGRVPTREECGLPGSGVVFCCFNQAYKILPEMFGAWMRILQAVPGSVLWLAEANRWQSANLRREAAARGVAGERLIFAPRKPLGEYMVQYRISDVALDTFPYTSHSTAADALWMECPLVACVGETFASRVSGSVLRSAGLQEFAVDNLGDYERRVVELATSPDRLQDVRRRLREARDTCPLFDTPRFAKNLEDAYEKIFSAFVASNRR